MDNNKDKASLASQSQAAQPTIVQLLMDMANFSGKGGMKSVNEFAGRAKEALAHLAGQSQATKAQAEPKIPAHLCEFVQAVAHDFTAYDEGDDEHYCRGCSALIVNEAPGTRHQDGCIVPRAKAALAAPVAKEAPAVPEGHVTVPLVATTEMLHAGMRFFHDKREPASKAWGVYRAMIAAAPVASIAKAETLAQTEAEEAQLYRDLTGDAMALGFDGIPAALEALRQANVLPPTRGTDSQLDAGDAALDDEEINNLLDGVQASWWDVPHGASLAFARAIEAEVARRFRAQGGDTSDKGSDRAPTTSTVSAPEDDKLRAEYHAQFGTAWMHGGKVGGTIPTFEAWKAERTAAQSSTDQQG